jgi:hypothetical protein
MSGRLLADHVAVSRLHVSRAAFARSAVPAMRHLAVLACGVVFPPSAASIVLIDRHINHSLPSINDLGFKMMRLLGL